jgi:hypothetical protein
LKQTLSIGKDKEQTMKAMSEWRKAPGSLESHPDQLDEHFVPLLVATGAAQGDPAKSSGGIFY